MPTHTLPTALHAHQESFTGEVRALTVTPRVQNGTLTLGFDLEADLSRLRIPREAAPQRAAELWMHTCFEAFVRVAGEPGYWEINFAPSRAWAVYRFSARREGMAAVETVRAPKIIVHRTASQLALDGTLALRELSGGGTAPRRMQMAAAAVLEDANGRLAYWAVRHPPGKPDFHHPDSFALEFDL
jgi:hypothetical protein